MVDWYETADSIVIVLYKNRKDSEQLNVEIHEKKVVIGEECIDLYKEVDRRGSISHYSTRTEIVLTKKVKGIWGGLTSPTLGGKYKFDIEEEDEKGEGAEKGGNVMSLFQSIYENADDETRKAMNKSFVESNGTVLSTDWSKVGKKRVEPKE
jgi:suppressor of G2 allele of SKP1